MTGKPWCVDEERQLRTLVSAGVSFVEIADMLGKSEEAVRAKIKRLGLDDNKQAKSECLSSCSSDLPEDLPSVYEQLQILVAAVKSLQTPGIEKNEIMRLRNLIHGVEVYLDRFGQFQNYSALEKKVDKLISDLGKDPNG